MPKDAEISAYCGTPPVPVELWTRWNFDPPLIAAAVLLAVAYAWGWQNGQTGPGHPPSPRDAALFFAGWFLAVLSVFSPLCALSVALFSARATQHIVLSAVAAPLIILGRADAAFAALLRPIAPSRLSSRLDGFLPIMSTPPFAWLAFALSLWFWHAPEPYEWTFRSPVFYWAMHVSIFGSALLLWRALLTVDAPGRLSHVAYAFTTVLHMGLLGALITLAPRPIYEAHAATTAHWGLNALADQQLGGVIMWVPGCGLFLVATLFMVSALLRTLGEQPSLHSG